MILILSQSKLIPNLFQLILQNKDKPTGALVQNIISCLTTFSDKREMIQIMIEHGLVAIQLQLIQDQLKFFNNRSNNDEYFIRIIIFT